MLSLVYRRAALDDLDAIYDYIAADSPERAAGVIDEIRRRCRTLIRHPLLGPARDHVRPGLRILPLPPRVVVAYRVSSDSIVVLRIFQGGRDYEVLRNGEPPP